MTKIILKKLKEYDTMWHPDSTLVFKSSTEKLVIGRYVNNELISLDEEALELCEKWKFKYDSSLIEEEVETEGDDVEDEKVQEEEEPTGEEEQKTDDVSEEEEVSPEPEEITGSINSIEVKEVEIKEVEINEPLREMTASEVDFTVNFKFLDKYLLDFKSSIDSNNENQAQRITKLQDKLNDRNRDCEKYQKEIDNHKDQYTKITDEYNKMSSEYSTIKEEYNKLKMKFEGIKNLFAL
jgi:chromosome segregation ATPase